MRINETLKKPMLEAKYLNVDNTDRYRPIIRLFYLNYEKLKYWIYQEEVYEELKEDPYQEYTPEQCQQDLTALTAWGNLITTQDTRRVTTIEEFKNKKFRYQLSKATVEIERMVIRVENLFIESSSLEPTLLERIRMNLEKIPQKLVEYTLKHFNETKIENVFGKTEQALYEELIHDHSTASYVSETPVFYIDKDFSVYPNITAPAPAWFLGNLKTEGIETILKNYTESKSVAQAMRLTVPLCDIVASQGDCQSQRLFDKGDYIDYLTNKYCRK